MSDNKKIIINESQDEAQEKINKNNIAKNKKGFFVVDGKSITSQKGIVANGQKVSEKYFAGGLKTINALIKSGHIVEVK